MDIELDKTLEMKLKNMETRINYLELQPIFQKENELYQALRKVDPTSLDKKSVETLIFSLTSLRELINMKLSQLEKNSP